MTNENMLSFQRMDEVTVARLEYSEVTAETGELLHNRLLALAESEKRDLVLDLSNLRFVCSVGLGVLVVLLKKVKEHGGRLALAGVTGHCLSVLKVTGLTKVFDLHPTVEAAIQALHFPAPKARAEAHA